MLGLLALIIGLVIGLFWKVNIPPVYWTYIALLILVIIDSLMYALAMYSRKIYDQRMVYLSLVANFILASCITALGDQIGLQLYFCPFFAFGVRIFQNFGRALAAFIENVDEYNARRQFEKYQRNLIKNSNHNKTKSKEAKRTEDKDFTRDKNKSLEKSSAKLEAMSGNFPNNKQVQVNIEKLNNSSSINNVYDNISNKQTNLSSMSARKEFVAGGAFQDASLKIARSQSNNFKLGNKSNLNNEKNTQSKNKYFKYQDNYSYYQDLDNVNSVRVNLDNKVNREKSHQQIKSDNREKNLNQINSSFLQKDSTFRFEAVPESFKNNNKK